MTKISSTTAAFIALIFSALFMTMPYPESEISLDWTTHEALQKHLKHLAKSPKPLGTPEHLEARTYIQETLQASGIQTTLQEGLVDNHENGPPLNLAKVGNVVGFIPGDSPESILFVAHYDTVPASMGAGDNTASIAILLEEAKYLQKSAARKKSAVFLFSDAEEIGLLGAKQFLRDETFRDQITCFIVLDARGASGPPIAFQTRPRSASLIEAMQKSRTGYASAMFSYFLQFVSHDTEFSLLQNKYDCGMAVANIDSPLGYHNRLDHLDNLSIPSLLSRARIVHSVAQELVVVGKQTQVETPVYFTLFPQLIVTYAHDITLSISLLICLLTLTLIITVWRKNQARFKPILLGWLSYPLGCLLMALLYVGSRMGALRLIPESSATLGYHPPWEALFMLTIGFGVGAWIWKNLARLANETERQLGFLLVLLSFALASSPHPDLAFFFLWPLAFHALHIWAYNFTGSAGLKAFTAILSFSVTALIQGQIVRILFLTLPPEIVAPIAAIVVSNIYCLYLSIPGNWLLRIKRPMVCTTLALIGLMGVEYLLSRSSHQLPIIDRIVLNRNLDDGNSYAIVYSDAAKNRIESNYAGTFAAIEEPYLAPFWPHIFKMEIPQTTERSFEISLEELKGDASGRLYNAIVRFSEKPHLVRWVFRDHSSLESIEIDATTLFSREKLAYSNDENILVFDHWNPGASEQFQIRFKGDKPQAGTIQAIYYDYSNRFPANISASDYLPQWDSHRHSVSKTVTFPEAGG